MFLALKVINNLLHEPLGTGCPPTPPVQAKLVTIRLCIAAPSTHPGGACTALRQTASDNTHAAVPLIQPLPHRRA